MSLWENIVYCCHKIYKELTKKVGPKMRGFPGHTGLEQGDDKGRGLPKGAGRPKSTQVFQLLVGGERRGDSVEVTLF